MSTELQITPDQSAFTDKQLAALRALGVQNAPPADVALLFHQAARTGLDPFARQIYLIGRGGKYSIQTGIDGFRVIRDRSHTYQGHTEEWCGPDGQWKDVWLEKGNPAAARVQVYVQGFQVPVTGVARWTEYAQESSPTWKKMPALMLAKCAEALALRKAYPQDLSGLYSEEELPVVEQDHDGVYVTTTMRDDSRTETPHNRKSGHATEAEVKTRPVGKSSPDSGRSPGRPRTDPVAGTADMLPSTKAFIDASNEFRDQLEVANMWIGRVRETDNMDALIKLRAEVVSRGSVILDYRDLGDHTVDQWFNRRRTELQQAAAGEPEPTIHLSDDEAVYDDDNVPY